MIVDKIANAHLYMCCGDNLAKAFEILKDKSLTEKPDGKYEVDGKNLYYLVQRYQSKPLAEGKFEAHQKYIDIQYVSSGEEMLGYAPIDGLEVQTPYNPEKDIIFYNRPAKFTPVHLKAGLFAVLYPDDAHMPGRMVDNPANVLKIVIKVKIGMEVSNMIGKLQRVPLKNVWPNEAKDFTPWLQENVDVLNAVIDMTLTGAEKEQPAGDFSVDLLAEDEGGNTIIIENQLGKSDHDHLGKLVTYLSSYDAKAAVWIVSDPRPEHIQAITWLNESRTASFYLVKVEAVRIGESPAAPLFTLIVGPSEEGREIGETKKELAARHILREKFWNELLERAKKKTKLHANISTSTSSWIGTGAGKTGFGFNYAVRRHDANVELYIDRGKGADEETKKVFDALIASKSEIEAVFGEKLEWQRLEGKRACRIKKTIPDGGYLDEQMWPEIHEKMIDAMIRLEKALKPHIANLKI